MYKFDPKKFAKRTRQEKLASENERIQNDNIKLRQLVVDLAKANMELGGTGEGSKSGEGEEVPALPEGVEDEQLAIQGACGELSSREDARAEDGKGEEGIKE